jgi:hypothetical protein
LDGGNAISARFYVMAQKPRLSGLDIFLRAAQSQQRRLVDVVALSS